MRQIELDQHFLDRADKLKERGELPGEIENDTHLRIMEKYLEVYDAKAKQLQEEINSLKGARDAESLKKISDNRKAIQHLKARQKRHRANTFLFLVSFDRKHVCSKLVSVDRRFK